MNGEPTKEISTQPEILKINPELKQLLNESFRICSDEFLEKNQEKSDDPDVLNFLENLVMLEKSINENSDFVIRRQLTDESGALHINLSQKDNLNFNRKCQMAHLNLILNPMQIL